MQEKADVFGKNYEHYCKQIQDVDFKSAAKKLKVEYQKGRLRVRFYDRFFWISSEGIVDEEGNRPGYVVCVILFKYVLLCPETLQQDEQWFAFRDFKKDAFLTNLNFFSSDTEEAIKNYFEGRLSELFSACEILGGTQCDVGANYDISMKFDVLPMISQLLLFNDKDAEFPAQCKVLFYKHTEFYLDPESLAMTGAVLSKKLVGISEKHQTVS